MTNWHTFLAFPCPYLKSWYARPKSVTLQTKLSSRRTLRAARSRWIIYENILSYILNMITLVKKYHLVTKKHQFYRNRTNVWNQCLKLWTKSSEKAVVDYNPGIRERLSVRHLTAFTMLEHWRSNTSTPSAYDREWVRVPDSRSTGVVSIPDFNIL